jgi:hypothetical protein
MFDKLKALFQPQTKVVYKVVEVPTPRTHLQGGEKEVRESIYTLAAHPGFVALTSRLSLQCAALKTKLNHERHADMRAVDFLQAGVYWSNWLMLELQRATTKMPERKLDAMEEEVAAFREIDAQLERVGMD